MSPTTTRPCPELPSATAACAFVRDEPGGLEAVLVSTGVRAAIIAAGTIVAGFSPRVALKAGVAGAVAIEVFVLGNAWRDDELAKRGATP